MKKKIIFASSGGKDSALALYELLKDDAYEVVSLLTTITEDYDRISMHGVRTELLEQQAASIGLPLEKVFISKNSSNEDYGNAMRETLEKFESLGVSAVAFGDIYLEDVRRYREEMLSQVGMMAIFPLWGRNSSEIARDFFEKGFKAVITCADSQTGCGQFAGRDYDAALLSELPETVDPCFENGECHSFVYDGPIFEWPIKFTKGETVLREERYYFSDLLPDPAAYLMSSERLLFRRFTPDDLDLLHQMLSDSEVMKYYPSILTREGSEKWLDGILHDYELNGFGWSAVHLKETGEFIGQAGITIRDLESKQRYLLGYMFNKHFWGKGYATEASRALINHALTILGADCVEVLIRPVNIPSQKVVKRLGLKHDRKFDYKGYEHDVYIADSILD